MGEGRIFCSAQCAITLECELEQRSCLPFTLLHCFVLTFYGAFLFLINILKCLVAHLRKIVVWSLQEACC